MAWGEEPATDRQREFLRKLGASEQTIAGLTKAAASELIEEYLYEEEIERQEQARQEVRARDAQGRFVAQPQPPQVVYTPSGDPLSPRATVVLVGGVIGLALLGVVCNMESRGPRVPMRDTSAAPIESPSITPQASPAPMPVELPMPKPATVAPPSLDDLALGMSLDEVQGILGDGRRKSGAVLPDGTEREVYQWDIGSCTFDDDALVEVRGPTNRTYPVSVFTGQRANKSEGSVYVRPPVRAVPVPPPGKPLMGPQW